MSAPFIYLCLRVILFVNNYRTKEIFVNLFIVGEAAAGKASRSLAQHIPGQGSVEGMRVAAGGAVGDLARARIALDERGQRLGELEERTAQMMASAETFSKHAHEVSQKERREQKTWITAQVILK